MNDQSTFESTVRHAAKFVQDRWSKPPKFGIILGTGAGKLAQEIDSEEEIPYGEIPNFPKSTALGHKGQFVCGSLAGQDVIAMEGRFHLYEGYDVDKATLAVHTMQRLGVEILFVSNASGGINPKFASGQIMLIESHLDFMFRSTRAREWLSYPPRRLCRDVGSQLRDSLGVSIPPSHRRRRCGDVDMSIITNVAKPDILEATSGQEVIDAAVVAAPYLKSIVVNAIKLNSEIAS